jgi:hypothetical protein
VSNTSRERTTKAQALFLITIDIPDEVAHDSSIGTGEKAAIPLAVLS